MQAGMGSDCADWCGAAGRYRLEWDRTVRTGVAQPGGAGSCVRAGVCSLNSSHGGGTLSWWWAAYVTMTNFEVPV